MDTEDEDDDLPDVPDAQEPAQQQTEEPDIEVEGDDAEGENQPPVNNVDGAEEGTRAWRSQEEKQLNRAEAVQSSKTTRGRQSRKLPKAVDRPNHRTDTARCKGPSSERGMWSWTIRVRSLLWLGHTWMLRHTIGT